MKKWKTLVILGGLVLAGCTSHNATATKNTSQEEGTRSSQQQSSSSLTATSSSEASSSAGEISGTETSESTQTSATTETQTNEITTSEQALTLAKTQVAELKSQDIGVTFMQQLADGSFLIKATSKSLAAGGGSGTVGFYKVTKEGAISLTDAAGNPQ